MSVWHCHDVLLPSGQQGKGGPALQNSRRRVAVKLGLGQDRRGDGKTILTVGDIEGGYWRVMGNLDIFKKSSKLKSPI